MNAVNKEALQMWEQMNDFGKSAMDSLLRFNELTSRSLERIAQHQLAMMGECVESTVNQFKVLGEAKSVPDALLVQTRLASECGEKWMANTRRVLEISLQVQTELGQWMNDSLNRLNAQGRQITEQVQATTQRAA